MKRLILLLFSVFAGISVQAQQKVTLKQCNGDTVAYVKQNFEQGKARFIGQPFSKVLEEWKVQLPVNRLLFGNTGNWPSDESKRQLVNSASLYYITQSEQGLRVLRKEPYYVLAVVFAPPFHDKVRDYWHLQEQEGEQLGPQLYEKLKDYIVQDIALVEMK